MSKQEKHRNKYSLEELGSWRSHPITKDIMGVLQDLADKCRDEMSHPNVFLNENEINRGYRVGYIDGLEEFVNCRDNKVYQLLVKKEVTEDD